jgi:hypothetical protein
VVWHAFQNIDLQKLEEEKTNVRHRKISKISILGVGFPEPKFCEESIQYVVAFLERKMCISRDTVFFLIFCFFNVFSGLKFCVESNGDIYSP